VVIADQRVLTNAHNLHDRTTEVTFADGRAAQGEVCGADTDGDLVVLTTDTTGATAAEWSGNVPTAGAVVFAAARSAWGLRVTFGLVSGVDQQFRGPDGRRITAGVEHTAPLARGSSGGPLVDAEGRLLGINTHRLGDGFYLARPADAALRERVDQLVAGRSPTHRRLGIAVAPTAMARRMRRAVGLAERDGLLVRAVEDGSPAAGASIAIGDLVVSANGRDVRSADDLWAVLDEPGTAAVVELGILRGVDELTVPVALGPDPSTTEPGPS
jgi:S1-C subfamily serine protease